MINARWTVLRSLAVYRLLGWSPLLRRWLFRNNWWSESLSLLHLKELYLSFPAFACHAVVPVVILWRLLLSAYPLLQGVFPSLPYFRFFTGHTVTAYRFDFERCTVITKFDAVVEITIVVICHAIAMIVIEWVHVVSYIIHHIFARSVNSSFTLLVVSYLILTLPSFHGQKSIVIIWILMEL